MEDGALWVPMSNRVGAGEDIGAKVGIIAEDVAVFFEVVGFAHEISDALYEHFVISFSHWGIGVFTLKDETDAIVCPCGRIRLLIDFSNGLLANPLVSLNALGHVFFME